MKRFVLRSAVAASSVGAVLLMSGAAGAGVASAGVPHVAAVPVHTSAGSSVITEGDWRSIIDRFAIAMAVALGLVLIALIAGYLARDRNQSGTFFGVLRTGIEGMPSGWSFKDSWASNITVAASIVVALMASNDLLKSILGTAPDRPVAVMAVASAVASAFVLGAVLLVNTMTNRDNLPVVAGLLAAAVLTATGSLGQIWLISTQASRLDLGPVRTHAALISVLPTLLLAAYVVRSLFVIVRDHTNPHPPVDTSDTLKAAYILARAIRASQPLAAAPQVDWDNEVGQWTEAVASFRDNRSDIVNVVGSDQFAHFDRLAAAVDELAQEPATTSRPRVRRGLVL